MNEHIFLDLAAQRGRDILRERLAAVGAERGAPRWALLLLGLIGR